MSLSLVISMALNVGLGWLVLHMTSGRTKERARADYNEAVIKSLEAQVGNLTERGTNANVLDGLRRKADNKRLREPKSDK
jgi:hypothetical protein